jgi:hypothetical protein
MCLVSDYQGYLKTQSSFRGMAVIFQSVSYNNHEGFKALFQMVFYKRYSSQSDFGIRSIVLRKDLVIKPESYDNAWPRSQVFTEESLAWDLNIFGFRMY